MSEFDDHGLKAGRWSGVLASPQAPARVVVTHLSQVVATASVTPAGDGAWRIEADLPARLLSDGIHSLVLIADDGQGDEPPGPGAAQLARLPLLAGSVLADDLVAEIEHLRAELELLKREFRRFAGNG